MEKKIAHLNMIQGVITRMANNSFALKGWSVTLVAALFALSGKDANQFYYLVTYIPIVVFWFLDAYYLYQERRYRDLYALVIAREENEIDFSMVPPIPAFQGDEEQVKKAKAKFEREKFFRSFISKTILGFYLPLALVAAGIVAITAMI